MLLGLWRSVVLGGEEELIPEPDEEELMLMNAQSWIEELPDTEKDEQPNVIFVLGESFFDVTQLPGVSYAEDPGRGLPPHLLRGRVRPSSTRTRSATARRTSSSR